jgi:hypothetical protein
VVSSCGWFYFFSCTSHSYTSTATLRISIVWLCVDHITQ